MAGDWIKMRGNLWSDPRISRLCDMTDQGEATIIGGLYWLWATADQHSEDGIMLGLSIRSIDRNTGIKGFGDALSAIGWIADHPEGVRIVRFDEHNGSSAKKRCQTAKRVANFKAGNAEVTHEALPDDCNSVSTALPREREEREKSQQPISEQTMGGETSAPAKPDAPQKSRQTIMPADFYPNETGVRYAEERRINIAIELQGMRNWAESKRVLRSSWQATWRTWCDKAVEFGRAGVQANGARASPSQSRDDGRRQVLEVLTGAGRNEQRSERDITGEVVRLAG